MERDNRQETYSLEEVAANTIDIPTKGKFIDLTRGTFGKLEILAYCGRYKKHSWWYCKCGCGSIIKLSANSLRSGGRKSCAACSFGAMGERMSVFTHKEDILNKFPNLQVISSGSKARSKETWEFLCNDCGVSFRMKPYNLKGKYNATPCMCENGVKFKQWTKELRDIQISAIIKESDICSYRWVDTYRNNKSRIELSCGKDANHASWTTSINNFVAGKGYGCPECGINKRAESSKHDNNLISKKGVLVHGSKYGYDKFVYQDSRTPSKILCKSCDKYFNQSYDNHINKKKGCPSCAGYGYSSAKYGYFYLQSLDGKFLKFGISNIHPIERMKYQSNKSSLIHKMIKYWGFEDGNTPRKMETLIKQSIPRSVVPREDMPDGFTETCLTEEMDNILRILVDSGFVQDIII